MTVHEKSRAFIYRSARPVDLAVFRHAFENAPAEDIITALAAYQNPDGSFYVPWTWGNDYKEWYIAENWCKAIAAIDNLKFLREFDSPE